MIRWYLRAIIKTLRHPSSILIGLRINACMFRVWWHEKYMREFRFNDKMESNYSLDKKLVDAVKARMDEILQERIEIKELGKLWHR